MTGMIREETIGDHSVNAAWMAKLRAENPRIVAEYKGFAIQMTESAVFAEDEHGLSFLFAYTTEHLFRRAVTKATADRRGGNISGMAGYIFWHALFPLQNAVMAGEGYSIFWGDRAYEAFERGAQVCFVEISSSKVKHVADADTFQALGGRLWGCEGVSPRAKALRIVISQEPIQGQGELRLEDLVES